MKIKYYHWAAYSLVNESHHRVLKLWVWKAGADGLSDLTICVLIFGLDLVQFLKQILYPLDPSNQTFLLSS